MVLDSFPFQEVHILPTPAVGTTRCLSEIPGCSQYSRGLSVGTKGWKQLTHKENPQNPFRFSELHSTCGDNVMLFSRINTLL